MLGGAEKQALFLAQYLQNKKKCNVYIYSHVPYTESDLFYKECKKYGLKNLYKVNNPLSASGKFKYLKRRVKIALFALKLKKHKPDVIIPYLNPPSIIASLVYKIAAAKKTFWHHRGVDYYRNDLIEQKAKQKCPLFIANSPNGKTELINKFDLNHDSVKVTPNFTTLQKSNLQFNKEIKELNKITENTIVFGMIGHFRAEKLQHLVLKAFKIVAKKSSNIHLVLAGNIYESNEEKSNFTEVKKIIEMYNLSERVTILHNKYGYQVLPYLDVGMLVSTKEGMPNTVMEYMAYGLPVITTNHEGCIALLDEDYSFFVDNKVESIVEKMNILLSDEKLCKEIGDQNQEKLFKEFSIENYIKKLEEVL